MRKLIVALTLSAAAFSSSGVMAADAIVGYVSDLKCATTGSGKKAATEWIQPALFEQCVKDCVHKEGSEAVFVTEDNKILKFEASAKDRIAPFLGHKVSVTGKIDGTTLKVDRITGLKLQ